MAGLGYRRATTTLDALFCALAGLCLLPAFALAQTVSLNRSGPEAGGIVNGIAQSGHTVYAGGDFGAVQSVVGGGIPVDPTTGAKAPGFPAVAGFVYAAIPDGADGWFVGGEFTGVEGKPRRNLAHILADGRVADWAPDPDGIVQSLVIQGRTLVVGGAYTTLAGTQRDNIGAVDLYTGVALPWATGTDQGIVSMVSRGDTLFMGGYFTQVAGAPRLGLAALDLRGGELLPWNPGAGGYIYALAAYQDTVIVGGRFVGLGGAGRYCLGAVDMRTGSATSWDPQLVQSIPDRFIPADAVGLALSHDTLYVGGVFDSIGGRSRNSLAAISLSQRAVLDWDPQPVAAEGFPAIITYLALHDGRLYLAGAVTHIGGLPTLRNPTTASIDTRTATADSSWHMAPNDGIWVISSDRKHVFFGGFFTSVGDRISRRGVAAFDVDTGAPTGWVADIDGYVRALAVDHGRIYIGGDFQHVNGVARPFLAEIDSATSEVTSWAPRCSGTVWSMAVTESLLYAGGQFGLIGDSARAYVAAISRNSGAATAWYPRPNDIVSAILPQTDRVLLGGAFSRLGDTVRLYAGATDTQIGTVTPWDPKPNSFVECLAATDSVIYLGGGFDHVGTQSRSCAAAVDTRTAQVLPWRADLYAVDTGPTLWRVIARDNAVYLGGRFFSINGVPRENLAAVDPGTGEPLDWRADANGTVWSLGWGTAGLLVGGRIQRVGNTAVSLIAAVSQFDSHGSGQPPVLPGTLGQLALTNPASERCFVRFGLGKVAMVDLQVFDLQGRMVHSVPRRLTSPGARLIEVPTRDLRAGCYAIKLSADGVTRTGKMVVIH
ncbi:MAG: hypothetical protein ABL977_02985 [Candidatus Eisenbacteria bacterium]